jgi:hypothetical protein
MLHAKKTKNKTSKNKMKKLFVFVTNMFKSVVLLPYKTYKYIKSLVVKLFRLVLNTIIKIVKTILLVPYKIYTFVKNLVVKTAKAVWAVVVKIVKTLLFLVVKTAKAVWAVVKDLIAEMWTLLGMFIAWVTLEGSAKTIVGYATLLALTIWIISLPLRMEKDE